MTRWIHPVQERNIDPVKQRSVTVIVVRGFRLVETIFYITFLCLLFLYNILYNAVLFVYLIV